MCGSMPSSAQVRALNVVHIGRVGSPRGQLRVATGSGSPRPGRGGVGALLDPQSFLVSASFDCKVKVWRLPPLAGLPGSATGAAGGLVRRPSTRGGELALAHGHEATGVCVPEAGVFLRWDRRALPYPIGVQRALGTSLARDRSVVAIAAIVGLS